MRPCIVWMYILTTAAYGVAEACHFCSALLRSLNPEFLEPAMHEVMTELMMALWSHLRPSPIQFGKKVRRGRHWGVLCWLHNVHSQAHVLELWTKCKPSDCSHDRNNYLVLRTPHVLRLAPVISCELPLRRR